MLIWQSMLPSCALDTEIDFSRVASKFEFSGGEIRNCALAAAFSAASENSRVKWKHLQWAIRRELVKNGRVVDEARFD